MQEIIHAFGIDWRLIVIQIFNFGLLVGVLWYFLYTPILNLLSEREEKIKKGIDDAENAARTFREADTEKVLILKNAHSEAGQIVSRGTQYAEEKAQAMLSETSEKILKQLEVAKAEAAEIRAKTLKESESEIAKLAILGAEKVLNTELSK